jgi:glycosyltransferase involved in cell wall biosynthesis
MLREEPQMMTASEPKVSVITPVYNTAEYLAQCMESVRAQSYSNWEYHVVDNCSTDDSREIAESFAARDDRIHVHAANDFLSQVANYNRALGYVDQDSVYCKMVQADDWIYPECIEQMVRVAETSNRIGIVGAYQRAGADIKCQGLDSADSGSCDTVVPGSVACRLFFLENRYLFGTPTTLLFRSDIVRGRSPFYEEGSYHEDSEACFDILKSSDFGFVHRVLTYTRVDNESLSTSVQEFAPDALHRYMIVRKFGGNYLTEAENEECLRDARDAYYRFLSYNFLRRRGSDFWSYHRRGFRMAGDRLSRRKLTWMQVPRIARWLGNPLATAEALLAAVKGVPKRKDRTKS